MMVENWLIWLSIAIIFLIGAVLSHRFFHVWFAMGAAQTSLVAFFGLDTTQQLEFFLLTSGILILILIPRREKREVSPRDIIKGYHGIEPEYPKEKDGGS